VDAISYRTKFANKQSVSKDWAVIDAKGKVLGRVASEIARLIRGKHKTDYTPFVDCGDNVIVLNADEIVLTGKKWDDKIYLSHTGYPGGQKAISAKHLKEKSSILLVENAVKGMLPKNRLGRKLNKNLFVYEGAEHPHEAQSPKSIEI
jgi:large subunit ribosomal protein L13